MLLSEHVYCVTVTFIMTERAEQGICIKFCMKLEHSSTETIPTIQKAAAMGKWWLAHHILCRDFWWNIKSPRWLNPLQPRFGALQLLAFPKTKITFERGEISDHPWDSGKYNEAADGDSNKGYWRVWFEQWKRCWENCVRSQGAYMEGAWGVIVLCTMFLVPCIFFNKWSLS